MTQDDKLTRFLGELADNREKVGTTVGEHGFADDNRFTFNLSPRMRQFALALFAKYGEALGWKDVNSPPVTR